MERFVALMVVVALATTGCGGDGEGTDGEPQPPADVADVVRGALDALPRMDDSRELTEATESDGGISQSFGVTMTTPLQVVRFYRAELPRVGWEQISTADATEAGGLRGEWWQGDRVLEVSAGYASTIDSDVATDEQMVEYSLILRPVDAPRQTR